MDVSIVIVNYNSSALVADCVESIRNLVRAASYEIIVVDNASTPSDLAVLESIEGIDVLVENSINLGFGTANNCGVERARGDFVFFLNPDCLLLNDAVLYFLAFFNTVPDAGVAGCYLVDAVGNPNHYCGSFSGHEPKNFILSEARQTLKSMKNAFGVRVHRVHQASVSHRKFSPAITRSVDWLNGAALFMPRKVFLEVGGFDEILA